MADCWISAGARLCFFGVLQLVYFTLCWTLWHCAHPQREPVPDGQLEVCFLRAEQPPTQQQQRRAACGAITCNTTLIIATCVLFNRGLPHRMSVRCFVVVFFFLSWWKDHIKMLSCFVITFFFSFATRPLAEFDWKGFRVRLRPLCSSRTLQQHAPADLRESTSEGSF